MSSSAGASAPVFSYAQAAKGLASAASTKSTSRNESPAASDKSAKERTTYEPGLTSVALKSPRLRSDFDDKSRAEGPTGNDNTPTDALPSSSVVSDIVDKEASPQDQHALMNGNGDTSPVSQVDALPDLNLQKDEPGQQLTNGSRPSSEPSSLPVLSEQDNQNLPEKNAKDGEDDWEKVVMPSVPIEAQYKAAPIPPVNVWQIRKEAQAAKMKDIPKPIVSGNSNQSKKSRSVSEDFVRKPSTKDTPAVEKEAKNVDSAAISHRKDVASARSSRPPTQQGEKADGEVPPPVIDTSSWPTPENSTMDDRRKSASYEKTDLKLGPQKSHGNKWVTVPFVPTAKFETQLPPAAARRGGRGGGRGRDVSNRGGGQAGTSAEKQDATASMGPPPLPRPSGEHDRGRRPDAQQIVHSTSLPTSRTRPTSNGDPIGTTPQPSATETTSQSYVENAIADFSAAQPSGEGQAARTEHSSRSSSLNTGNLGTRRVNGERGTQAEQAAGTFVQPKEPILRYSITHDRSKGLATGSSRGNGDFARDRGAGKTRDWSKEKPESAREKVESWRDRETSGEQGSRRGGRAERGRGNYRGRGENSFTPSFTAAHAYTSPLPQNGFDPPSRSTSQAEARSRQTSQPFVPTQSTNTRNVARSLSIPVGMTVPGYYNSMPSMTQQGPPAIQTDMNVYGYPPQMPMPPSIMSAMPYNDPLNSYALLSMVMTQIEYYFSIDNLCKDLFLRKHMDGQGYVLLSVIANFKRIKTLTQDAMTVDSLRYVCQQVKSVEFLSSFDGDDRLRRREGWRDFVLPVEERFETARNEGPVHNPESFSRSTPQEETVPLDPSFSYGQLRSPPMNVASNNGPFQPTSSQSYLSAAPEDQQIIGGPGLHHLDESSTDAASRSHVPAYSHVLPATIRSPPPHAATPLNNIINGHHRYGSRTDIEENVFPDEQIPHVNIRMQPHTLSGAAPSFPGIARLASQGPSSGPSENNSVPVDVTQTRLPGLRGGAGSPHQLEQLRNISFGNSAVVPVSDDSIMYFTKDGHETQLPPPQPGQFDQTYLSLHDIAFQQRQMGVKDALEPLYHFWTDFLVDKFNLGMYQEFKNTAINDAQEGNESGMDYLVRYFGKILSGPIPISQRLAEDVVNLSRDKRSEPRLMFQIMRAAWRNGATNMKTIKRLGDVLTIEEKAELDKSG